METKGQEVSYIRKDDLIRIRKYLTEQKKVVLSAFIDIGVNTALSFSELSNFRFENIDPDFSIDIKLKNLRNNNINPGSFLSSSEKTTLVNKRIYFNSTCIRAINNLKEYYKSLGYNTDNGYLFKSLSSENIKYKKDMPLTINSISRQFTKLKATLAIPYPIGTSSLKKTWLHFAFNAASKSDSDENNNNFYCKIEV